MTKIKPVLGTMTFGESVFGDTVKDFLNIFAEAGYDELDTAYVYNEGECERLLGQAFRALEGTGTKFTVATKVNPRISGKLDADAAYKQVNESLERMGLDAVDTVYLHFPDPATPVISVLGACADLNAQGKFRNLGLSNFPAWMVADVWHICNEHGWVLPTVYEGMYNPIARRAETELKACLDHFGMRYYAYNPLAGGLLTGRYTDFEEAPDDGRFTHRPNYKGRYWKKSSFEALALLKETAEKHGMTVIEAVYRWLANHSMLDPAKGDAVIIGGSKPEHLMGNLKALQAGPLPEELVDAFEKAWEITKADAPQYFTLYKAKRS